MKSQPDDSVDLVFGSPPYVGKGQRYNGDCPNRTTDQWIEWMLEVTREAVRISRGMAVWIVNGAVRNRRYLPACEGLLWQWHAYGGHAERSCIWVKNALPNRNDWFVNCWEFVLVFKQPESRSTFHWQSVAEPPKSSRPQKFGHRDSSGKRVMRKAVDANRLARPRDVIRIPVGVGLMGHPLAHKNEAPLPLKLAEHFVRVCSAPGDTVLDPFVGSGTTLHACLNAGRSGIGIDTRQSQIDLACQRLISLGENPSRWNQPIGPEVDGVDSYGVTDFDPNIDVAR